MEADIVSLHYISEQNSFRRCLVSLSLFSVAKATLQSQMSVCLSVRLKSKPLSLSELLLLTIESMDHQTIDHRAFRQYWPLSLLTIKPNDHRAYRPLSLSTIELIDHWAYRPLSLLIIRPIDHRAYWPSSLSTIKPIDHQAYNFWSSFTTFKPFGLLSSLELIFPALWIFWSLRNSTFF